MVWDANHIRWAEQVVILWAVLPPVFVIAAVSIFAAPFLEKRKQKAVDGTVVISPLQTAAAEAGHS